MCPNRGNTHGPYRTLYLCTRCKFAFTNSGYPRHVKGCFGTNTCKACGGSFPCKNSACALRMHEPVVVPDELREFFDSRTLPSDHEALPETVKAYARAWLESVTGSRHQTID